MEPTPGLCVRAAWQCGEGGLRKVLRLVAADSESGGGSGESALRTETVTLERPETNTVETPCILYLQCAEQLAEIIFVEVVSEAKTMEVYTEEEYCGTCQGQRVDNPQKNSGHHVIMFKKYLKLDFPSSSCELKLLSLGGKEKIQIGEIVLGIRRASVNISRGISPLGNNINLQRVQTMMDSMGTKLSPGAQQLLNMVQFQQKHSRATLGGLFQGMFGTQTLAEIGKAVGSSQITAQSKDGVSAHECIETNSIAISRLEETKEPEEIIVSNGECAEKTGALNLATGINNTVCVSEANTKDAGEQKFARGDMREAVSTYLCKQNNGEQNTISSEMLPFLRNLSSQVNDLRIGEKSKTFKNYPTTEDGMNSRLHQQTFCFELEKHITEHMESVENRLKDYIDHRLNILQDDLDKKFVSLTKLIENITVNRTVTKSFECGAVLTNGGL
ncbi:ATPase PAAT isoform X1 [Mobula birostris]|uniref:ATPase PAAT isoform X1 n=2 Tax=Mobula birostris TaxID=1983395 RepID=UPI003B27E1C8